MDAKLLLVQAIALLYWDAKRPDRPTENREIIHTLVEGVKLPENLLDTDNGRDNLINLKYTVEDLLNQQEEINGTVLNQRLRLSIRDDSELLAVALEAIQESDDWESRCATYATNIRRHFEEVKFLETMRKFMAQSLYANKAINSRKMAREFINELEVFATADTGEGQARENPLVIKGGGFGDRALITGQLKEAIEQINMEGLLRTGYKGVNRMLHIGGLIRGDCYVVGARRGMNKTGMTMDITLDVAHYNHPYMLDPNKKPMILHITKENSYDQNLRYIAERCYYLKHKKFLNYQEVSEEYVAELIQEYTEGTGYHFESIWVPGGSATVMDLQSIVLEYEKQGFEIHLLTIDYLALVNKAGLESHTAGAEIRDAFRRMRNFCNPKKITLLTPHQVSSQATELVRQGEINFVEKVAGMDYWDGSKRLTQEIDVEIIINIEKVKKDGVTHSYQTMCIGKNRAVKNMPESHKSCAMEFTEWGLIPDLEKENEETYYKNIADIRQTFSEDGGEEAW